MFGAWGHNLDLWRYGIETLSGLQDFTRDSIDDRWILSPIISDVHLWYYFCTLEQTVELPVIWDSIAHTWRHCNGFDIEAGHFLKNVF